VGRGASQSCGMVSVVGDRSVSSEVEESDSMESLVVMGWMPVSAMTYIRSGTLWSVCVCIYIHSYAYTYIAIDRGTHIHIDINRERGEIGRGA